MGKVEELQGDISERTSMLCIEMNFNDMYVKFLQYNIDTNTICRSDALFIDLRDTNMHTQMYVH